MDDHTNPGAGQGTPPDDAGMTRRMDTPPSGGAGQPAHESQPYGATEYGAPAQAQPPYSYSQPPAYEPAGQAPQYGTPTQPPEAYPYNQPPAYPPAGQAPQQYAAPQPYSPPAQYPAQQYTAPQQYSAPQPYNTVPGGYTPAPGSGMSSYVANPPVRDPMLAMVIEMVGGFLGFMGIGNMLAGRLVPGLILMVSWWAIVGIGFTLLTIATCGLGICLVIPLWLAGPILSGLYLRGEMSGQPLMRR